MNFNPQTSLSFIKQLIEKQKPNHSLLPQFYIDQRIYQHELEKIFFSDWLYICHVSQVPNTGDCYTFDIANESVIISRDEQMQLHAFANVCRHRGSKLCDAGSSSVKRFVCPYHAWVYNLNGDLVSARQMPDDFDKSRSGLIKLSLQTFCGLIFVSFSPDPPSFEFLIENLSKPLKVFDIENTQVAHHEVHPIQANWKLVFENFNECYHCGPAHKEFSASHSLMLSAERQAEFDVQIAQRAPLVGISAQSIGLSQTDPQAHKMASYYYDRYALFEGYQTGSKDGNLVAPLLGNVKGYDGGASNVQIGNLTYLLIYADHIVLYRFIPRSVNSTDAEIIWLVKSNENENNDVDIERMRWLWSVTTAADKDIIERNQQGVLSRFYEPGPYAPMEIYTIDFIQWYLRRIQS